MSRHNPMVAAPHVFVVDKLAIVFMTAHPRDEDRRRAVRGGAVLYLEKPVSANVLIPSVKAARPPA